MTDRELLEMAAKAAGHALVWGEKYAIGGDTVDCSDMPYIKSIHPDEFDACWNPLTDDGDALRLAVKLQIHVQPDGRYAWASTFEVNATEPVGGDPYAATRRAIVRAAAELARAGAQKG